MIEQFEAAHPNITIEAEYGGSDGYHDKLATQLASGTAADIVQVDPEVFPTYVTTGDYFIDYKDYDMDLSNFDEIIFPWRSMDAMMESSQVFQLVFPVLVCW